MERVPPLSRFEVSPVRRALEDWLREIPVGEVASYADLSTVAGEDVRGVWHLVRSAREALLKEGMVFDVVPNTGLRRADDVGKVNAGQTYADKGARAARRALRLLRTADFDALPPDARVRYTTTELRAGMMHQFGNERTARKVEAAITGGASVKQLSASVRDTLKQFGKAS